MVYLLVRLEPGMEPAADSAAAHAPPHACSLQSTKSTRRPPCSPLREPGPVISRMSYSHSHNLAQHCLAMSPPSPPPLQVCLWELYRRRRCPLTTADRERMAALSTRGARAHTFERTASADAWLLTDRGTRLVGQLVTGAARPFPSHPLALRAQVWAHQHRWLGSVAGTRSG